MGQELRLARRDPDGDGAGERLGEERKGPIGGKAGRHPASRARRSHAERRRGGRRRAGRRGAALPPGVGRRGGRCHRSRGVERRLGGRPCRAHRSPTRSAARATPPSGRLVESGRAGKWTPRLRPPRTPNWERQGPNGRRVADPVYSLDAAPRGHLDPAGLPADPPAGLRRAPDLALRVHGSGRGARGQRPRPPGGVRGHPDASTAFMGLKFFLEDQLGRKVDLVTPDALKPRMRPVVEREAVNVA